MINSNDKKIKDQRALEALLAAAFRLDFPEELSDEEAERFFQQSVQLSKEDKEAVNSWGTDFIEKLIEMEEKILMNHQQNIVVDEEIEQQYFAMNRDNEGNGIDEDTRQKIDEERRKALEEENNKDKNDDESRSETNN